MKKHDKSVLVFVAVGAASIASWFGADLFKHKDCASLAIECDHKQVPVQVCRDGYIGIPKDALGTLDGLKHCRYDGGVEFDIPASNLK